MDELWHLGAVELATLVRTGEASSREVVEAHLHRMDEVNPALNAVVRRMDNEALLAADAADQSRAAGGVLGPLHGVPFTVKEGIAVAGTPTTLGMRAFADAVAPRDDPLVERMRQAGAIPIGRTNLPDASFRPQTHSSLHGLTLNPWNVGHSTGGSSGGEGAALATGMSPLGLGTDFGGSIRIPAHCCGVAGHKPTVGLIPMASGPPPVMMSAQLMAVAGSMARRVEDLLAALAAAAGQHDRDPQSVPAVLADMPDRPLRIAVLAEPDGMTVEPTVAAAVATAANVLAAAGHEIVHDAVVPFAATADLWCLMIAPELASRREAARDSLDAGVITIMDSVIARQPHLDATTWSHVLGERYQLQRQWAKLFTHVDVVLAPTLTVAAWDIDEDIASAESTQATLNAFAPTTVASVAGLPAVTVPVTSLDDIPLSVQAIAWRFCDRIALGCARAIEETVGTLTPIDPRVRN